MKTLRWAAALGLLATLAAGRAEAQDEFPLGLRQPDSLRQLALEHEVYLQPVTDVAGQPPKLTISQPPQSAAGQPPKPAVGQPAAAVPIQRLPAAEPAATSEAASPARAGFDPAYAPGTVAACEDRCLAREPAVCRAGQRRRAGWLSTLDAGGWVQAGITCNGQDPANRFNGPVLPDDRAGELQMHQLWLYLDRSARTGGYGWDFGGRLDATYGTDWRYLDAYGLDERINAEDQFYGLSPVQFYGEVGYNDLKVKLGRFLPHFGYEAVPAVSNFFYSHTYSMLYHEPLSVTGMLAEYALSDQWSIQAGFHRGYNMFEDVNDKLDFLGGLAWTSRSGRDKLAFKLNNGPEDPAGAHNRFVYSFIYEHRFGERMTYALHHVLGNENDTGRGGQDDNWYGLTHYLIYRINGRWSAGCRVEWYRDAAGAQIVGLGNLYPGRGWPGRAGFEGDFVDLSLGLNYQPHPNVVFRPEIRWDWYNGTTNVDGQWPFDDGHKPYQFLLSADLIVRF